MKKLILILSLATAQMAFAQDKEFIDFNKDIQGGLSYCQMHPEAQALVSFKLEAGYIHTWVAGFVQDLKDAYPTLEIQDNWSYGVLSRTVELVIKGECREVIDASMAIQNYLSGSN